MTSDDWPDNVRPTRCELHLRGGPRDGDVIDHGAQWPPKWIRVGRWRPATYRRVATAYDRRDGRAIALFDHRPRHG